jgi:hypothetical protein
MPRQRCFPFVHRASLSLPLSVSLCLSLSLSLSLSLPHTTYNIGFWLVGRYRLRSADIACLRALLRRRPAGNVDGGLRYRRISTSASLGNDFMTILVVVQCFVCANRVLLFDFRVIKRSLCLRVFTYFSFFETEIKTREILLFF